jgi:hypothetical protein
MVLCFRRIFNDVCQAIFLTLVVARVRHSSGEVFLNLVDFGGV